MTWVVTFDLSFSVAQKERVVEEPSKDVKGADKNKGKDKKGKAPKGQEKVKEGSRPPSTTFDHTKPHWNLRIVSDGTASVSLRSLLQEHSRHVS